MFKIVGKIAVFFLLVSYTFAAQAYLQTQNIQEGDRAILVLSASGDKVEFPQINKIGDFEIASTSMQQNTQIINGNFSKKVQKIYYFYPNADVKIPSFELKVDGNIEKTQELFLHVKKSDITNSAYSLVMELGKKEVYENEAVPLKFIFKMRKDLRVVDLRFSPPLLDDFWVKEGLKSDPKEEGEFIVHEINYILFPQKSGEKKLEKAHVDIGLANMQTDIFGMVTQGARYKKVYSNALSLHVKPLENTKFVGDFEIKLEVDKRKIEANEQINATLRISGYGNFDDIGEIALKTPAAVFSDKAQIKTRPNEKTLEGFYEKKFSLTYDKNFVIEPIEFLFYSQKENKLKKIVTQRIDIEVSKKNVEKELFLSPVAKEKVVIKEVHTKEYFLYGVISGILLSILSLIMYKKSAFLRWKRKEDFKNEKEMLKKLLTIQTALAKEYIKEIEEYLYGKTKTPLDRKKIKKFIKSYEE